MRKFSVLALLATSLVFTSCDPWEDENNFNNPSEPITPDQIMYLKEVKSVFATAESKQTYTYDSNNRLTKVIGYLDVSDTSSYTEGDYIYVQNGVTLTNKTYMNNQLMQTSTSTLTINGNQGNLNMESQMNGENMTMNSVITFSMPCGESSMVTTSNMPGFPPFENTSTYDYFDQNCSYKLTENGVLSETVYMDDKFNPHTDITSIGFNLVKHNPVKIIDHTEGITENISYEYNSNGYPTKAVHTFSSNQNELDYTEYFTYY